MQATSSQVITPSVLPTARPLINAVENEPAALILPALKHEASISGRDHLLVRRRRRDRRQQNR